MLQSRVKGESSLKRKEQSTSFSFLTPISSLLTFAPVTPPDRVAQRAFRKRQKSYFHDLEREVGEKSERIQVIWKSNAYLVDVMQKLQQENIEVSFSRADSRSGKVLTIGLSPWDCS
jgi:hypothetical protein